MKKLLFILSLSAMSWACNEKIDSEIDADQLTECPENVTKCSYLFSESTNLDPFYRFQSGEYRLFFYTMELKTGCDAFSTLYIKAPMAGTNFSLDKKDIIGGNVLYSTVCPCCDYIALKPVDGYVKGIKINPDKRADQSKWLIEAEIVLGTEHSNNFDTLRVKQYFRPN